MSWTTACDKKLAKKRRTRHHAAAETLRHRQIGIGDPLDVVAQLYRAGDNEAMTEQEWLECQDPQPMLEFLRAKVNERKLRLFACACCRGFWDRLSERDRHVVQVVERFIEGEASEQELATAREELRGSFSDRSVRAHAWAAAQPSQSAGQSHALGSSPIVRLAAEIGNTVRHHWNQPADTEMVRTVFTVAFLPFIVLEGAMNYFRWPAERSPEQPSLIRDIFGNPFRPVSIKPAWQTTNATALAQSIYDERAFERMPIVADALEDAGCDNADILNHCRQPGEHVRGCWVVDLVLGKD